MCMMRQRGQDHDMGRTVHRVNPMTEAALYRELGENVQMYVSSVDHNEAHLHHAFQRDDKFKELLLKEILKNKNQLPLVVLYERDPNIFLAGCRYYSEDPHSKVLQARQYLALLQAVDLIENGQKQEALCVTMFRIPNT